MNAVGNTMANFFGFAVPIMGAASTRIFGSYMPLFLQAIFLNIIGMNF